MSAARFRRLFLVLVTAVGMTVAALTAASPAAAAPSAASASASPASGANTPAAANCLAPSAVSVRPDPGQKVSFDRNSLLIGGKRVFIWAGEFDYWLMPSPSLWCDRFQKMRAEGYNAVSVYFNWDYQSPAPGTVDAFTGVTNISLFLRMAKNAGLYVIARPGPYLNAAADSGGLPGWVSTLSGTSRTSAPDYTAAYMNWLSAVDPIVAANQITRGGSVILYQVDNEYDFNIDPVYMEDIEVKAAAEGITVPMYTNDCCFTGDFASGPGAPAMYAVDNYPQGFSCSNPNVWNQVPQWFTKQEQVAPDDPKFMAEMQGGFGDRWADLPDGQCQYARTNSQFVNIFDEAVLGQGATLVDTYLGVGGIQRGWTADPNAPSLADQGAGINTTGELTQKAQAQKLLGYMVQSVPSLTQTEPASAAPPANPAVAEEALTSPGTGTGYYALRPADTNSTASLSTHIAIDTPAGDYPSVPQAAGTSIELNGREARFLIADDDLGPATLVYSTSELLTRQEIGGRAVTVLYGPAGEDGETVLRYAAQPGVQVLSGNVSSTWDASRGDLRLDYVHSGLAEVLITAPGKAPLLLMLADRTTAESFWLVTTPAGPALAWGPYLVRAAGTLGSAALGLTGEAAQGGPLDVIAPPAARTLAWNGRQLATTPTADGALQAEIPGPVPVSPSVQLTGVPAPTPGGPAGATLPALTGWRLAYESPEIQPGFDDSSWTAADHTTTANPTKPATLPVLYADDYGYHYGDVWYRGHFTATGAETGITLDGETGNASAGAYSVWLNGAFLGTQANGVHTFAFPSGTLRSGADNVIAVLVQNMGHDQDSNVNDANKHPRGLAEAALQGAGTPVTWRIQGGDATADPVRGPLNSDGLYGATHGWALPGYPDENWQPVTLPDSWPAQGLPGTGVGWYRTTFSLRLPQGQDTPIGLAFDTSDSRDYRALVYLNGWLVGRYDNTVGPESNFYLPAGILNPDGGNTLAIAAWGENATSGGLGRVRLVSYGTYTGGLPVSPVTSPGYHGAPQAPAIAPALALASSSGGAAVSPGQTVTVTATFSNSGSGTLRDITATLPVPSGWSARLTSPASAAAVAPGASARFTWSVTAPPSLASGQVTLTAQASYQAASHPGPDNFTAAALALTGA